MAFEKKSMVILLAMVIGFCCICEGTLYKVGDSAGWTDNGKVDYKAWSSSKTFHVGDTILFQYDNRFSNVVRVNHHDYNRCSNLHAYFSFNSGNDSFIIPKAGHFYFISGLANHCQSGQRVNIRVHHGTTPLVPAPAPAPSSPSPPAPSSPSPPAPSSPPAPAPAPSSPSPPTPSSPPAPVVAPTTPPSTPAAPAHTPAPSGSSGSPPAPTPDATKKNSGAISVSGKGWTIVMALATAFYGLVC